MRHLLATLSAPLLLAALSTPAQAQEESSPSINLGSSRIGGPGLTKRERKMVKSWDEPDEYLTEESLPPKGDKKRMKGLHTLARRYYGGKAWKEACTKYDMIIEEGGKGAEGLLLDPQGQKKAAKSFYHCADIAFKVTEYEKAERLLKKSESLGPSTFKHKLVRRKMVLERYHKKLQNGDIDGAYQLYQEYQKAGKPDDEQRIWFGEQLSAMALNAHKQGDKLTTKEIMAKIELVAPQNTEYRKLKDKLAMQEGILGKMISFSGIVIAIVVLFGLLAKWRANSRLKVSKSPFDDLDDEF